MHTEKDLMVQIKMQKEGYIGTQCPFVQTVE